jgi:hypothetical protein
VISKFPASWHRSTSETVERASLSLQRVDDLETMSAPHRMVARDLETHIQAGHCLAFGVLGICHGITNDGFQKRLQDTPSFFVAKLTVSVKSIRVLKLVGDYGMRRSD